MKNTVRFAIIASCLLHMCGCRTINRTAERKIRDVLPSYIGPAHAWRAHVENNPERTIRGRLSSVTIDGESVTLKQAIVCRELHIQMRDVDFDIGRRKLKSVGRTTFQAVVSESDLNDYLVNSPPPDDDPVRIKRVFLKRGQIYVKSTRWLMGRAWPFTVNVVPRLRTPTRLDFEPDRMTVVGLKVPLPKSTLRYFARKLDTGFDFTTLPFPLSITSFRVEPGALYVDGRADVMQSLNEQIDSR